MTTSRPHHDRPEPERYELFEGAHYRFTFPRRDFLRTAAGGLVVALTVGDGEVQGAPARDRRGGRRGGRSGEVPESLGAWIRVDEDSAVTVYTGKVEVGQGIRTSLAQTVAEELGVAVDRIRMVMGDTDLVPYDRGTFGSRSTPQMGRQLRIVAATASDVLAGLAADRWGVDRKAIRLENGAAWHPSKAESLSFGELTRGKSLTAIVDEKIAAVPASGWKVAGTSVPRVSARAVVTGRHRYVSDLQHEGQLHGKILRAPSFRAEILSVNLKPAQAIPGVTVIHDGNFVGVAAADPARAEQALAAIEARWKEIPQPGSAELFDYLVEHPIHRAGWRGRTERKEGSVRRGLRRAKHRLEQTYTVPYIAHAPLEPRAAVAQWVGDKVLVWSGTQRPFGVRAEVADAFRLPESRVRVMVPDTGSGYGGKHTGETAVEAARLAKAAGKPVKVVWTREEEFTWAYFRPAGVMKIKGGVDGKGRLVAWEHLNYGSGSSAIGVRCDVANHRVVSQPTETLARQGSYRCLAATANHFARESAMDELAEAVGIGPLEFRRRNLTDARMLAVLNAAAGQFGWEGRTAKRGHGSGLAVGYDKGGFVANCVEVAVDDHNRVIVTRIVTAFECGAIVNPDNLTNQVEGSVIMGLGGALFEEIRLANGRVENPSFSGYRVPRLTDIPPLETVRLDRKDLPSAGAGEAPIVVIAPALANAICAATGQRIRSMPLTRDGELM